MENIGLHVKLGAENKELLNKLKESKEQIGQTQKSVNQFGDNVGVLRQRYRELSQTSMVGKSPEEIKKMEAELARLRDGMGDYQARINSMSLDPFQKAAQGIEALSTGLAGAAGVMTLFGGNQEKMNELMQKTVALIAISKAAQTAADFTKQNAIGIYLKDKTLEIAARIKEALTIDTVTIATKAEEAAKGKSSAATKVIIALQKAWNATLKASPIFVIVTVIAAVVAAVYALSQAFNKNKREADAVAESIERLNEGYKRLQDSNKYYLALAAAAGDDQTAISKERIKQIDDEIAALENLKNENIKLAQETKALGFGQTKRAKEAADKLKEINAEIIELERERNIKTTELNTAANKLKQQQEDEAAKIRQQKAKEAADLRIQMEKDTAQKLADAGIVALKPLPTKVTATVKVDIIVPPPEQILGDLIKPIEQKGIEIGEILSSAVESGMENMVSALAEGVGMLASGEADMGDVFRVLGEQVANFADALGKSLIAAGIASEAFKKLFANPFLAIAAGTALVAAAALVRSKLKAGVSGGGSSSGGGGVYTPRVSSQESAPASEWQSRSVNLSGQTVEVTGTLRASGTELVAVIDSENKRRSY